MPAPTITASPTILTSYYQPSSFRAKTTSSTGQYFKEFNNQTLEAQAIERERLRVEFYATYDVMTGIRIAATLGGFFFFMVFLIVFKSRSHSNKAMNVSCFFVVNFTFFILKMLNYNLRIPK